MRAKVAGYDNLDLEAWGARGVPVCNVPDYGTTEVADHALALMLALTRGTDTYDRLLNSDPANGWSFSRAPLVRLRGATFGIVGLGRIGLAAALPRRRLRHARRLLRSASFERRRIVDRLRARAQSA